MRICGMIGSGEKMDRPMKIERLTTKQLACAMGQVDGGALIQELSRSFRTRGQTFFRW